MSLGLLLQLLLLPFMATWRQEWIQYAYCWNERKGVEIWFMMNDVWDEGRIRKN